MNVTRVIVAGLAAGLVVSVVEAIANVVLLGAQNRQMLESLGLAEPSGVAIAGLTGIGVAVGLLVAWVYAVAFAAFGPGAGTVAASALTVWGATFVLPVANMAFVGVYDARLATSILAYTLIELAAAALAVGLIYRQGGAGG